MAKGMHWSWEISLKNIGGLSNKNFIVTITNKTTKEIIDQILYRKFGEISDVVERDLETMIINQLSEIGIAPKIYEIDPNAFLLTTDAYQSIGEYGNKRRKRKWKNGVYKV